MARKLFVLILKGYQKIISPYLGPCCRFSPSCSEYAIQAYQKYGVLKGSFLMIKRLVKCHPFSQGGKDLLP